MDFPSPVSLTPTAARPVALPLVADRAKQAPLQTLQLEDSLGWASLADQGLNMKINHVRISTFHLKTVW